ncbi:MAG: PKD domain-containing protein [Bacteroidetes bacterium]|nr:PKD domain-containing protein [Bacteroidota bacterium]
MPTVNNPSGSSVQVTVAAETPVANPTITTYSLYCSTTGQYVQANGTLGATEVFQTAAQWGTKIVTGLTQNTQYCFYAKAKNADGDVQFNGVGLTPTWGTNGVQNFDSYTYVSNYCGSQISSIPWIFCDLGGSNGTWSRITTGGCSGNALQYNKPSAANGTGSLLRSEKFDGTGQTTVTVSFDMTNSYSASYLSDRIYMWVGDWSYGGGLYTSNGTTSTQNVYFDKARNCERVELTFNISALTYKNNLNFGIWSNSSGAAHNYDVILDNFSVNVSPVTACVTTLNCTDPTVYDVTGGGNYCSGGGGVAVGLSNSQTGVNYQLKDGVANVGSPVAGNTGSAISFGNQTTATTYTVIATNGACSATMNGNAAVTVSTCGGGSTWTGATSTAWHDATNWNPVGIPNDCSAQVLITSNPINGRFPIISIANYSVGDITLQTNARVTANGFNLQVCGNWNGGTGSKTLSLGNGEVIMLGTAAQTIEGSTQFDILRIFNNSVAGDGDVSLINAASVSINKGLHLASGNLLIDGGSSLRLRSTSDTHCAYIDDFTSGFTGNLTGSILADRFVPIRGYNQHYISSPVSTPALSQIGASGPDGSFITPTANCDESQSAKTTVYGSIFAYDDDHQAPGACKLGNWMVKSQGNMENGKGYSAYLAGNSIKTVTGVPNTGNISISGMNNKGSIPVATLQSTLTPIESGWNLVGNPYPSTLHLTISRIGDGFDNQVQVWKTSGPFSGSWIPKVIGAPGAQGQIDIAPFQAFMVLKTSAGNNGSYPFYQGERVRASNTTFYRTDMNNTLVMELNYNGMKDLTTVQFNADATIGFDGAFDANKSSSAVGKPMLFTHLNAGRGYSINTLHALQETTTVPMGLRPEVNGTMTLSAQELSSFDPTTYIYLEDKQAGVWHNLRNGDYTFSTKKTDNQDRFVLHFTPAAQIMTSEASCSGSGMIELTQPGSANWDYSVADNNGTVLSTGTLNASSPVHVSANAGVYTLTLSDNNGYVVMKNIEVGGEQSIVAAFTASNYIAKAQEDITFNAHNADAVTTEWNFGDGSNASTTDATHRYTSEGVYTVSLTVLNEAGCKSVTSQTITITSREATGLANNTSKKLNIWSADNRVFIDFGGQTKVEAEIDLYNIIGQLISSEQFGRSSIYSKEIPNLEAAYLIVKVKNEGVTTTKRVFIGNVK